MLLSLNHLSVKMGAAQPLFVSINPAFVEDHDSPHWIPLPSDLRWYILDNGDTCDLAISDWRPSDEYKNSYRGVLLHTFLEYQPRIAEWIGLGNEVRIIGLFPLHHGTTRHRPIVRGGNISLFPADRIATPIGAIEAYLVETRSLGGLSGSPVFAIYMGDFPMAWHPFLGVVHGHWDYKLPMEETQKRDAAVHSGMTIVSPGRKLAQILFSDELVNARAKYNCMDLADI